MHAFSTQTSQRHLKKKEDVRRSFQSNGLLIFFLKIDNIFESVYTQ